MKHYEFIAPLLEINKPETTDWEVVAKQAQCSVKTLRRWVTAFQKQGLAGLARQRRKDKGERRSVSPELKHRIEAYYLEHGARSMATVHRMAREYARTHEENIPSPTVVRDICRALPASLVCMAREGEKAWRDRFEPINRHESHAPNERWQMDHCKLDILVIDIQSGKVLGRPWLTVALDTYSRAVMGYHLSLYEPTSMSICLALRQAIWHKPIAEWPMCGIPKQLHLDQGKDFTSRHLEQVAADLGITLIFATPYLARAKGKIERFWRTLNEQLWCELPGYVGPNVQERPEQVAPALTLSEIERYLVAYFLAVYHQRPHTTTGEPPVVRWQKIGFEPRMPVSLRQMDLLLTMSQTRKVLRDGLHMNGLIYWANELAGLIEERVLVRFDPQNVAFVVVYHNNRYLCTASVPELSGMKISLKEWHALQSQQRQSAHAAISAYRNYLDQDRSPQQLPLALATHGIDMLITLERLAAACQEDGPALFPSECQKPLLLSGGNYERHD
ncbi:MAG: DDE-type integrase/transposase/recombinase [Chloroflexota bacterium]